MREITYTHFGLLIAYVLPGFVVIWGISGLWPVAPICTGDTSTCSTLPSLIGFFNTTIGAITAGMVVSAIRFALIDTIHHLTGLKRPYLTGRELEDNLGAIHTAIDQYYRYYQFHSNAIIACLIAYGAHLYKTLAFTGLLEVILLFLVIVFWIAARDNLRHYYTKLATFNTSEKDTTMSNGMGNHKEDNGAKQKTSQVKKSNAAKGSNRPDPKAKPSKP